MTITVTVQDAYTRLGTAQGNLITSLTGGDQTSITAAGREFVDALAVVGGRESYLPLLGADVAVDTVREVRLAALRAALPPVLPSSTAVTAPLLSGVSPAPGWSLFDLRYVIVRWLAEVQAVDRAAS